MASMDIVIRSSWERRRLLFLRPNDDLRWVSVLASESPLVIVSGRWPLMPTPVSDVMVIRTTDMTTSRDTATRRHGEQHAVTRAKDEYSYSTTIGTRRFMAVKLISSLYNVRTTNMIISNMNRLMSSSRYLMTRTISVVLAVTVRGTPWLASPPTRLSVLLVLLRSRLPCLTTSLHLA